MGQFSVTFSYLTGSDLNDIQHPMCKWSGLSKDSRRREYVRYNGGFYAWIAEKPSAVLNTIIICKHSLSLSNQKI